MNGAHLGRRSFGHSGKFDLHDIISHISAFIGKNAVMVIALALAAITSIMGALKQVLIKIINAC